MTCSFCHRSVEGRVCLRCAAVRRECRGKRLDTLLSALSGQPVRSLAEVWAEQERQQAPRGGR